jgi:hypothetical protein
MVSAWLIPSNLSQRRSLAHSRKERCQLCVRPELSRLLSQDRVAPIRMTFLWRSSIESSACSLQSGFENFQIARFDTFPDPRTRPGSSTVRYDERRTFGIFGVVSYRASIEQARLIAKAQRKTLNAAFREWLQQFTQQSGSAEEFDSLMKQLKHIRAGRRFTRDEMNVR